jgi:MIP family channel proteins
MFNSKVFVAELIGTFALVFIGAGAAISGFGGLVGVALAHGLVITVFVYAYGHISGAHFNPAVTFGLALNGTVKRGDAAYYWAAQLLGAAIAAFSLNLFVGDIGVNGIQEGATIGLLTGPSPFIAMAVEAVLTFFLVNTVLHAAVAGRAGQFAGLAIGLTIVFAILTGGPMSGASLNPARSFGPALFSSSIDPAKPDLTNWIFYVAYVVGPLLGSALAVGLFKFLNSADAMPEGAKKPPKKK